MWARSQHVESCPDIGPACNGASPPSPYRHDVRLFLDDTFLDASWGVSSWLALEARVGMRVVAERPRYTELDGTPKTVTDDIHHKNETIAGLTDPWLVARFGAVKGAFVVNARLGVTLPVGRTESDPYELAARGLPHEHIQFGTGTFVPIVGGSFSWILPRVETTLSFLGQLSLYENGKGYRAPSRSFTTARVAVPLFDGVLRPFVAMDLAHEGRETWHGTEGLEGSSIRTDLLAGGGVAWRFVAPWQIEGGFRVRVARLADEGTLDFPALFQVALSAPITY